jgi:hypothetical protein
MRAIIDKERIAAVGQSLGLTKDLHLYFLIKLEIPAPFYQLYDALSEVAE